ncbi:TraB/GumN family protein [uncultured Bacteroides sp.]|uniref:TraB/GumN family protein n=1 Tax=uncultured Bacteroides sp. TaxID=162156 RepID=UPI0025CC7DF9|nr:TraB/GumN family protein [uncultured Bacteroides sp.]
MKKILGILLFIGIALNANAQLLWKISGNGQEKPSYILGTHHLVPLSIKDSIAGLPQAIDGTAQVYGEVVMSEAMSPEFMQTMQQSMMIAGDTTLQALFTPEQYEAVGKVVKENMMADIAMLAKLKPAAITQQLTVILCMKHLGGFNPQEQLDTYFQQQAIQNGKKVGGLETLQSQINVLFNSQTLQRQANLLYCLVSDIDKAMDQTKRLNEAYKAQKLDDMLKLMEERDGNSCDPLPGEMEALLDNRNKAWIEKMPTIMKDAPTLFVVGAGHLPGNNGVLNLLKQAGYSVEPMK